MKKTISVILTAVILMISVLPLNAFADEAPAETEPATMVAVEVPEEIEAAEIVEPMEIIESEEIAETIQIVQEPAAEQIPAEIGIICFRSSYYLKIKILR